MRLALALLLLAACSDHESPQVKRDPERQRRVVEPPSGRVRPLPPHAIRADGVGPYKLGATLADLLDELPSGPRIAQLDIPGVVHRSLLHAEEDAILIGGEPLGKASFVAVVGGEVARTDSGIHVGSTLDEVTRALGAPAEDPDRVRDPRLLVPSGMRNARVVLLGDRVIAIVITADADPGRPAPPRDGGVDGPGEVHWYVATDNDELSIRAPDAEKPLAQTKITGLQFAAVLHDEVVAISRTDDAALRTWLLTAFRLDGTRLVKTIEPTPLYQLSAANARWIGAELRDLDLYLELTSRPDAIEVGGLLTSRAGDKLRDVVVISPIPAPRRRAKSAPPEAIDAGISGGSEAGSAANSDHRAKP